MKSVATGTRKKILGGHKDTSDRKSSINLITKTKKLCIMIFDNVNKTYTLETKQITKKISCPLGWNFKGGSRITPTHKKEKNKR